MAIESLLQELKKTEDTEIRARIAEEYPADWEMEGIFQKSYQKYLKTAGKPPETRRGFFRMSHLIGSAACLLFVIGAYLMMDFPQERLPSVMQETTAAATTALPETTAASVENAVPETMASDIQTVTETIHTGTSYAETAEQTETRTVPVMTTAGTEASLQQPVMQTTTAMTENTTAPAATTISEAPTAPVVETTMTDTPESGTADSSVPTVEIVTTESSIIEETDMTETNDTRPVVTETESTKPAVTETEDTMPDITEPESTKTTLDIPETTARTEATTTTEETTTASETTGSELPEEETSESTTVVTESETLPDFAVTKEKALTRITCCKADLLSPDLSLGCRIRLRSMNLK